MPAKKKATPHDDSLDIEPIEPEEETDVPPGMHLIEDGEEEVIEEEIIAEVVTAPVPGKKKVKAPAQAEIVDEDEKTDEEEEEEEEIDEDDELKALDILERRLRRQEAEPASGNDSEEDMMGV